FVEPVVSTGLVNNIPVDSVTAFNRNVPKIIFWTYYDNFQKGDQFSLTWTVNGRLAAPINAAGGDFGRVIGELVPPEGGWPVGSHEITVSDMSGNVSATVRFRIHDGPTEFSVPPMRAPAGSVDQGQPGDEKTGDRCPDNWTICNGTCRSLLVDENNCGTCGRACPSKFYCSGGVCTEGTIHFDFRPYSAQWGDTISLWGDDYTGLDGVCIKLYGPGISANGIPLSCVNTTPGEGGRSWKYEWDTETIPATGIVRQAGTYEIRVYTKDYSDFLRGTIEFATSTWTVTCPEGQTTCGSSCVNLDTDSNNCGTCGVQCGTGQGCQNGQCVSGCGAGTTNCNGQCVNLNSDTSSCGQCGYGCPSITNGYPTCSQGTCTAACYGGYANCDGSLSNGCEVFPLSDSSNCGSCGVRCGSGQKCADGRCVTENLCGEGATECSGRCVILSADATNCGQCGYSCPSVANGWPVCRQGTCAASCNTGFADCDGNFANGCETNILTDRANCGRCNALCMVEFPCCANGNCVGPSQCPCPSGQTNCGGGCVDMQFDNNNCGSCGKICRPIAETCYYGVCTLIPK
ncbi:MAG: hypothetical protein LUQ64_01130, partial [Methanomicrobiales archaeon]|nr:hypothetical protein [Methanomicrobiales archaeon]